MTIIYRFKYFLFFITAIHIVNLEGLSIHAKKNSFSKEIQSHIEDISNKKLKKVLYTLSENKSLSSSQTPLRLMKMVMAERPHRLVSSLIPIVKKLLLLNGNPLSEQDCHAIMKYAITHQVPPKIIGYLIENKIFDPSYMRGNVRYDILSKFSIWRLFTVDIWSKYALPKNLYLTVRTINLLVMVVPLIFQLLLKINLVSPVSLPFFRIGLLGHVAILGVDTILSAFEVLYYRIKKVGIAPNYLILSLLSKRPAHEKEELGLLFLASGADPNAAFLLIEPLPLISSDPQVRLLYDLNRFSSYSYLTTLQLAVQYNILPLVKALIAKKADINIVAVIMKDTIKMEKSLMDKMEPKSDLVKLSEIYSRKSDKQTKKGIFHFAQPNSDVYVYLKKKLKPRNRKR